MVLYAFIPNKIMVFLGVFLLPGRDHVTFPAWRRHVGSLRAGRAGGHYGVLSHGQFEPLGLCGWQGENCVKGGSAIEPL